MSVANVGQVSGVAWNPAMPIPGMAAPPTEAPGPEQQDVSSIGSSNASLGLIPGPQVALGAARPSTPVPALPPGTPMQQAQAVVGETHAIISKVGGGSTAIGQAQATELVKLVDLASGQLNTILQNNPDPATVSYVQSTLSDLATARQAYVGLGGDISKDQQQDTQAWQTADKAVLADEQQVDQTLVQGVQANLGDGDGDGDGDGGGPPSS